MKLPEAEHYQADFDEERDWDGVGYSAGALAIIVALVIGFIAVSIVGLTVGGK